MENSVYFWVICESIMAKVFCRKLIYMVSRITKSFKPNSHGKSLDQVYVGYLESRYTFATKIKSI